MFMNSKTINNGVAGHGWVPVRDRSPVRASGPQQYAAAAPALNVWEDEAAFYLQAGPA